MTSEEDNPYWGEDEPSVTLRAPRTDDPCSSIYNQLKPTLEEHLASKYQHYFFPPIIVMHRDGPDIPSLVILFDESATIEIPTSDTLSEVVGTEFVVLIGTSESQPSALSIPAQRDYHSRINAGDSVEAVAGEVGSVGFFTKGAETILGITAGHVLESTVAESSHQVWAILESK